MHSQGSTIGKVKDEGPSSSSTADEGASQSASAGGANYERSDNAGAKKSKVSVPQSLFGRSVAPQGQVGREEEEPGERRTTRARRRTIGCTSSTRRWASTLRPWRYSTRTLKRRCTERKDAEEQFDKDFHEMLEKFATSRSRCVEASAAYDRTELNLNKGLGLVRSQFEATAAATLSLTVGTADRSTNEITYIQEALNLLDVLLLRESQEGYEFVGMEV